MSLFVHNSSRNSGEGRLFVLERPLFPRVAAAMEVASVVNLIQELADRNGVPVLKMSFGGQIIEKTLHLDPSGLFLVYSPTQNDLLDATVFLPHVHEFRAATDSFALRFADLDENTENSCFSLTLRNGTAWNFVFQAGNMALWRSAVEVLVYRAWEVLKRHPLKVLMIRMWPQLRFFDNAQERRQQKKGDVMTKEQKRRLEVLAIRRQLRTQQMEQQQDDPKDSTPRGDDHGHVRRHGNVRWAALRCEVVGAGPIEGVDGRLRGRSGLPRSLRRARRSGCALPSVLRGRAHGEAQTRAGGRGARARTETRREGCGRGAEEDEEKGRGGSCVRACWRTAPALMTPTTTMTCCGSEA
jgi:hypothetical protein